MGYELRREIRDLLPRGGVLTDKECRLILELADNANEETRRAWPGIEWLAEVCDIPNPKRVGEFLTSIARKWFELRVELGKDKNGKPYFAKSGKKSVYRLPTRAELVDRLGAAQVPPTPGLYPRKVPAKGGPQVPAMGGAEVPPTEGAQHPPTGGPFSSRLSSVLSSKIPSPPPAPSGVLEVVEGEIVEEGEDSTSSPEDQVQKLIDEAVGLRPNWSAADLRTQITAALGLLGESFEAVAELVRRTARDPDSARPSRITASGNPHLRAASTAMLIARADASPEPAFVVPLHPQAHRFEAKPDHSSECQHCPFPEPNQRHRVPKPRNDGHERAGWAPPGRHRAWQNPTDPNAYRGEL